MSSSKMMSTVARSSPYLARMSIEVFWMYATLGNRVRKTKRAFERELINGGMSKTDAKRISGCFDELKNEINGMVKNGATGFLKRRA